MQQGGGMKKVVIALLTTFTVVALYLWYDFFFGAPVVLVSKWADPWSSWLLFTAVYAIGSLWIAKMFIIGQVSAPISRMALWVVSQLDKLNDSTHGNLGKRLLKFGGATGFFLSSWFAGGILTTYLLEKSGYEGDMLKASAASCVVFAVMFSAQYAGIGALL